MTGPQPSPEGVALLLWASDPDVPGRLATPFAMAAAAAAMEARVEVYFTARSVLLLRPGVAAGLRGSSHPRTIADWMTDAQAHGARFYACTDALVAHGLSIDDLLPWCAGHGGAVRFMERSLSPGWRTLVF